MKIRLDEYLVKVKKVETKSQAKQLILLGKVSLNGEIIKKPGCFINPQLAEINIIDQAIYVGRGAYKLKLALEKFQIEAENKIILDVGASTGGFTDLLIQSKAEKIYAIDVGSGQLAEKLKKNSKVVNMEKTDIRSDFFIPDEADFAVVDLSYISLKLVLDKIFSFLKRGAFIIALFKPQFESGENLKNNDGVIKSLKKIKEIKKDFIIWCQKNNYQIKKIIPAPIKGKKGNQEFLVYLFRS